MDITDLPIPRRGNRARPGVLLSALHLRACSAPERPSSAMSRPCPIHGSGQTGCPICASIEAEATKAHSQGMPPELLPCPFCGGAAQIIPAAEVGRHIVRCNIWDNRCTVRPMTAAMLADLAVEAWNTRRHTDDYTNQKPPNPTASTPEAAS